MKTVDQLTKDEIIVALNKDWMTHDGMWFYHCVQQLGIEKTNELNLAAIEGMTLAEVYRVKKLLGFEKEKIESFSKLKALFLEIKTLFIPDFMGGILEFTEDERMIVGMQAGKCFAYKGMKKLNLLENYRCGVLFRIELMLKTLGLNFQLSKPIDKCLMHFEGFCQVEFTFDFS